ncbi:MAG: type II toxin-antitoxin system Phd/YefM family antitoxin [Roseburia sp.]|nr:type II toxin-antitoxin system Phd/YefM family antitoxin [Roseburia sp.]
MKTMCVTTANKFIKNAGAYLNDVLSGEQNVTVATENGNAVLLSEEEYNSLKETLYLLSVPGMREKLLEAQAQSPETCRVWNGEL